MAYSQSLAEKWGLLDNAVFSTQVKMYHGTRV